MAPGDLTVEQCQAVMQLQINLRRLDAALDANDRRWFLALCAIRQELQRRSKGVSRG